MATASKTKVVEVTSTWEVVVLEYVGVSPESVDFSQQRESITHKINVMARNRQEASEIALDLLKESSPWILSVQVVSRFTRGGARLTTDLPMENLNNAIRTFAAGGARGFAALYEYAVTATELLQQTFRRNN